MGLIHALSWKHSMGNLVVVDSFATESMRQPSAASTECASQFLFSFIFGGRHEEERCEWMSNYLLEFSCCCDGIVFS